VLLRSASKPTAVLNVPLVRFKRAFCPSAVLPPGKAGLGTGASGGLTACAIGQSAKQPISSAMTNQPRGGDAWFVRFPRFALNDEVVLRMVVFMVWGIFLLFVIFRNTQNCVRILLPDADVFC
jgi:hypothetical protein